MPTLFPLTCLFSIASFYLIWNNEPALDKSTLPVAFVAKRKDGSKIEGSISKINSKELLLSDGKKVLLSDLVSLAQKASVLPPLPHEDHLLLASGDRIPIRDLRLEDENLFFKHERLANGNETSIELNRVKMIWRIAPDGSISPEKIRHRLRLEQRQQDFMLLRNGDMVEGTLTKIREGKIEVESQKKTSGLRWTQISAITLSEELMERTILPANYVRIILKSSNNDGGRFTLSEWTSTNGMIQGKTLFGSPFQAPLEQVAHLDIFSNGIVRLDKIQAKQMSHESFLGESYTTQFGCNSLWRDAQIARSYHDFCIGMHGQGKIEYRLDDNFRFFSTQVGLDDRDGLGGQAEIRVIADGKSLPLPRSGILTSPQMPLDLHLDVKNCKALILEIRWHKRGSIRSVVNWAKPILIK